MKVIGLAGKPGSGKSAIGRALARRPGVEWIDLDRVAWETYAPGTTILDDLVERFGRAILSENGTIDRSRLGAIVFSDAEALADLEAIVHPAVVEALRRLSRSAAERGVRVLLVEGALLTMSDHVDPSEFDAMVWLEVPDEERRRRLRSLGRGGQVDRASKAAPAMDSIIVDAGGALADAVERTWAVVSGVTERPC